MGFFDSIPGIGGGGDSGGSTGGNTSPGPGGGSGGSSSSGDSSTPGGQGGATGSGGNTSSGTGGGTSGGDAAAGSGSSSGGSSSSGDSSDGGGPSSSSGSSNTPTRGASSPGAGTGGGSPSDSGTSTSSPGAGSGDSDSAPTGSRSSDGGTNNDGFDPSDAPGGGSIGASDGGGSDTPTPTRGGDGRSEPGGEPALGEESPGGETDSSAPDIQDETTNTVGNNNPDDVFNATEIDSETEQTLLNQTGQDPQNATISQVIVGETPETNTTGTNITETQRQQLLQQAAANDEFRDAEDFAITDTEVTADGQVRAEFEAAPLRVKTEREGEELENAIAEGVDQLDQQTPGREVEREDVEVTRTNDGLQFEIEDDADLERADTAVDINQQREQTGRFTRTDIGSQDRTITGTADQQQQEESVLLAPGPDAPEDASPEELIDAVDGDGALIETDIPTTQEGQQEAISNNLQRALGANPDNVGDPLRSGIEAGKDEFADTAGIQDDGTIDLSEADVQDSGPVAASAGVAVAAPEPVSTTTGAAVLTGLAIGGAGVAAADEVFDGDSTGQTNQDVNELPAPEQLPGETTTEIDAPESGTIAGEQGELSAPDSQQETGELGTPDQSEPTGELGQPEIEDNTGANEPIRAAEQTTRDPLLEEEEEQTDEPEITEEDIPTTPFEPIEQPTPDRFIREDRDRIVSRGSGTADTAEMAEEATDQQQTNNQFLDGTGSGQQQPADIAGAVDAETDITTAIDLETTTDTTLNTATTTTTSTTSLIDSLTATETTSQTTTTATPTTTTTGDPPTQQPRRRLDFDLDIDSDDSADDSDPLSGDEERFTAEGLDFSI